MRLPEGGNGVGSTRYRRDLFGFTGQIFSLHRVLRSSPSLAGGFYEVAPNLIFIYQMLQQAELTLGSYLLPMDSTPQRLSR